jgi:hypothetical protein
VAAVWEGDVGVVRFALLLPEQEEGFGDDLAGAAEPARQHLLGDEGLDVGLKLNLHTSAPAAGVVLAEILASPKLEIGAGIRPAQVAKTSLERSHYCTLVTIDP